MLLWTEKYRPQTVDTFVSNPYIKNLISSEDYPNLLLYGPPGTGKTTFAHLLADSCMELNASDERGISVVRNKIKTYASGINRKAIILDECDHLTRDAQQCLRRVIEDFSKNTRFIFIANSLPKIIQPLRSRLLKIKFECNQQNFSKLKEIGDAEKFTQRLQKYGDRTSKDEKYVDNWYKKVFRFCRYDLRRSINFIQGISQLEEFNIEEFFGYIPEAQDFFKITYENVGAFIKMFKSKGYSLLQLIHQLNETGMEDKEGAMLHKLLSLVEYRLMVGCSSEILLYHLCYEYLKFTKK